MLSFLDEQILDDKIQRGIEMLTKGIFKFDCINWIIESSTMPQQISFLTLSGPFQKLFLVVFATLTNN